MSNIEYVQERVPFEEVLAQLAEEAAELGKAALKLRRAIVGINPTPVTVMQASDNLEEEIADVLLCLEVIEFDLDDVEVLRQDMNAKLQRWVDRLREAEGRADHD